MSLDDRSSLMTQAQNSPNSSNAELPGTDLNRTGLAELHLANGAKMVPFAGWEMPVQYREGVTAEHLHTRSFASLFDVSHMGQISIRSSAEAIESLLPSDIVGLRPNQQRYSMLLTQQGTILDDVMITRRAHDFFLVVNASNTASDLAHLRSHLTGCEIEHQIDRGLLALQGPAAAAVLQRLAPASATLRFMEGTELTIAGSTCFATRSGYTGEDGFEISVANCDLERVASALLGEPDVRLAGLGARDTLRLEAGLCLHGHDISTTTTPLEANLGWAIPPVRRPGGARPGGYIGAEVIDRQRAEGVTRRRVGLVVEGRAPVREGAPLSTPSGELVGCVTSGTTTPSLGRPIAMGYVNTAVTSSDAGTALVATVRDRNIDVHIALLPFVPHRYAR
jgi:aminomethyltransferase